MENTCKNDWLCKFCPIIKWRKNLDSPCIYKHDSPYRKWMYSKRISKRKLYAIEISSLEWKWMEEYQNIKFDSSHLKLLKDILRTIKKES